MYNHEAYKQAKWHEYEVSTLRSYSLDEQARIWRRQENIWRRNPHTSEGRRFSEWYITNGGSLPADIPQTIANILYPLYEDSTIQSITNVVTNEKTGLADRFVRTAVVVPENGGASFDIVNQKGEILARINTSANDDWFIMDVIPAQDRLPVRRVLSNFRSNTPLDVTIDNGQVISIDLRSIDVREMEKHQ